jgi:hypothetical protein
MKIIIDMAKKRKNNQCLNCTGILLFGNVFFAEKYALDLLLSLPMIIKSERMLLFIVVK